MKSYHLNDLFIYFGDVLITHFNRGNNKQKTRMKESRQRNVGLEEHDKETWFNDLSNCH